MLKVFLLFANIIGINNNNIKNILNNLLFANTANINNNKV